MCGIVGYVGPQDATPIILNGLKKLEYRGYDSAGLAVVHDGALEIRKDAGKLSQLVELVQRSPIGGAPGVGHTRWATHGAPSARNAHPHVGQTGRVVVVHNGIVENFLELKDELTAEGVRIPVGDRHRIHRAPGGALSGGGLRFRARPPAAPSADPGRQRRGADFRR